MLIRILFGFLLGGLLAYVLRKPSAPHKLKLVSVPVPETPTAQIKIRKPDGRLFIEAPPESVYAIARRFEYFDQLFASGTNLMGENAAKLIVVEGERNFELEFYVIADSPGEFVGMRVEHEGTLYGTCLVRFDQTAGNLGTFAEISIKFKNVTPDILPAVSESAQRIIEHYLANLKSRCEAPAMAI